MDGITSMAGVHVPMKDNSMNLHRMKFLNTYVNSLSLSEILLFMDECISRKDYIHLVSVNVDQIMKIENNSEFRNVVNHAELVITDGTPLMWIARLLKTPIKQKIPGPYLAEEVLRHSAQKGYNVFLLGAAKGVAVKASDRMRAKYKGLNIAGTYSPPIGFECSKDEINHINNLLAKSEADIVIVGLGAPKQELFVYGNKEYYKVPVSLSLGAAIDFMAGNVRRAPGWINRLGFEWLFRFFLEPKRLFKRYFLDDLKIINLIFKYK